MSFSLSQLIAAVEHAITTTENDVWTWVTQIQSGLEVADQDLTKGLKWVASVAPSWVADLQAILVVAQAIPGLQIPVAAVEATTAAAAALTAVAAAENAGSSNATTLVQAYGAVVNAVAAKAAIKQVVTSASTPAKKA